MIRCIEYTDLSAIREINAQVLGYDVSLEQTEKQFERCSEANGHTILVFEDEKTGQVSGYIHAQVYESLYSNRGYNILGLAVLSAYQGQGIGSKLLKTVEKLALDRDISFIRLNSAEHRKQAHRFYEHLGYESDKLQYRFIKHL
ncbi:GNAT family N-acetyltransferase [Streptococcus suis]|uniref:Acetyltransferase (GNAT) family protein n=1 Tax=Streptococcus suis TaxID=1307 RepID=A0A0Z8ILH2_STRSU|nr:GNAT family N-acetyltransferase [Streptococcus suis]NQG64681.1 GNAT family N-acetyltransferase [Streptococcus suis]NQG66835.1 GNAT family N-acetyltransferase [Streptococcus suis]CYV37698.1 acetyltransferase (GNAT) family protein [Streptococcus suis]CYV42340.1 acetyltransferase (GNAT) family protein [Streptococcus suis]